MKHIFKLLIALAFVAGSFSCASQSGGKAKLKTQYDTASYMIGMSIGTNFEGMPSKDDLNPALIAKGITDLMEGGDTLFTMMEMQTFLRAFSMKEQAKAAADQAQANKGLQIKGEAFLSENQTKEGIIVTESGLQYRIIKKGSGRTPVATDRVKVHYTGKLTDGTIFDSSVARGTPSEFGLNQVIPGWTEGLQLMSEGSTYELYIPYTIGYGAAGQGQVIPPYATLIFEVELIEILSAE